MSVSPHPVIKMFTLHMNERNTFCPVDRAYGCSVAGRLAAQSHARCENSVQTHEKHGYPTKGGPWVPAMALCGGQIGTGHLQTPPPCIHSDPLATGKETEENSLCIDSNSH